jgi:DNA-directed RNA polymerase subunit RPC12/RpoP
MNIVHVEEVLTEQELLSLDSKCLKDSEVICLNCGNKADKIQDDAKMNKWKCSFCGSGGLMKHYRSEFKEQVDKGKLSLRVGSIILNNLGGLGIIDMIVGEMIYFHNGGASGMHSMYLIRNVIKF